MNMRMPLVFSITSGKGGVGKTNIAVNLACCLAKAKKRVLLLDADLGLANVDVIMGITPPYNLFHLLNESVPLGKILHPTEYGFKILPAASGVSDMLALNPGQKANLLESMDSLEEEIDYLIVDTGAGINDNVLYFNLAAQQRIVVLTPEPTSLTDAYAVIKVMRQSHQVNHFKVLVNMAQDEKSAKEVYTRLYKACDYFLSGVSLDYLGHVPRDPAVRTSVLEQKPFCAMVPSSPASLALNNVARAIQTWEVPSSLDGNIKFFWKRLLFRQ